MHTQETDRLILKIMAQYTLVPRSYWWKF